MRNNLLTVGIIDLKFNNLFSIYKAFVNLGYKTYVIPQKQKKINYDIVVIPGVGAFRSGMQAIEKYNYKDKLLDYLEKKDSFIYGICLGMQLLFEKSYEFGFTDGLGFIKGKVIKFNKNLKLKTNIGWNKIYISSSNLNSKFKKYDDHYFYFVHSYYAEPSEKKDILASSKNERIKFTSIVQKNNILGSQFHPEKSGKMGLDFLDTLYRFKD